MRRFYLFFAAALVVLLPFGLQAGEAGAPSKTLAKQYNTLSAKVISIDKATHTLTLENDRAEKFKVQVDPKVVKNFDQIKVGNLVVVQESQRWAVSLKKHQKGAKPGVGAAIETETAPPGAKPGMETKKTVQVTAEIVKIDAANQTVNLKGPEGNIIRVNVKDPNNLKELKKGDMVAATYTKAMAISVVPQPKK